MALAAHPMWAIALPRGPGRGITRGGPSARRPSARRMPGILEIYNSCLRLNLIVVVYLAHSQLIRSAIWDQLFINRNIINRRVINYIVYSAECSESRSGD